VIPSEGEAPSSLPGAETADVGREEPPSAADVAVSPSAAFVASLPDRVFSELCSALNCSREDVEGAIRASKVDPREALEILQALAPSYVAIKGRFASRKRGDTNGAFCLVADGLTGESLDLEIWVGDVDLPAGFDIGASWESVRSTLRDIPVTTEKGASRLLESLLRANFPATAVNALFKSPEALAEKQQAIKEALSSSFRVDLSCDLVLERFHKIRFDRSPLARRGLPEPSAEPTPEGSRQETLTPASQIRVPCRPYLDPVRGKPTSRLVPGERIPITVDESTGLGRLMGRILQKSGRPTVFPVESLEKQASGDVLVLLALSEGMKGIIKLPGEVRVRVAEPSDGSMGLPDRGPLLVAVALVGVGIALVAVLYLWFR